jgi:hypothetical protein
MNYEGPTQPDEFDRLTNNLQTHYKSFNKNAEINYYSSKYFAEKGYAIVSDTSSHTKENKEMIEKSKGKPRMTSFSHGTFYFPYEDRFNVLKYIAHDIKVENTICLIQIAYDREDEGFRMLLDIDSEYRVLSESEICSILDVYNETLKDYFTEYETSPINSFVSFCGPRLKKLQLSSGVHIVSHVRVSIAQAKQLFFGFKLRMYKKTFIDTNGLSFDDSIYKEKNKSVSLRMIYNNKVEKCPYCNSSNHYCMICKGDKTVSTSTYEPKICIINGKKSTPEEFRKLHDNFEIMLHNHSIWPEHSYEWRNDFKQPETDPDYILQDAFKQKKSKEKNKSLNKLVKPVVRQSTNLDHKNEAYNLLEQFIRKITYNEKSPYTEVNISSIKLVGKDPQMARRAIVCLSGQGCTYCLYKNDNHGQNRVYFELNTNCELILKCHSEKHGCKGKDHILFIIPSYIASRIICIKYMSSKSTNKGHSIKQRCSRISTSSIQNNINDKDENSDNNNHKRKSLKKELVLKRIKMMFSEDY